ncbi:MAG: BatD family protein [Victivallaceae bacterium]|nr:BatD family protein [Victivallaceae bacterium]
MRIEFAKLPIYLLLLTTLSFTATAATLRSSVMPPVVRQGEPFNLIFESDTETPPQLLSAVPDVRLIGTSSSVRLTNGAAVSTAVYTGVAGRSGELNIPPLELNVGGNSMKSEPLKLTVRPAAVPPPVEEKKSTGAPTVVSPANDNSPGYGEPSPGKLVSAVGVLPGGRTRFYVGEVIPLELRLFFKPEYLYLDRIEYPDMQLGKSLITDFGSINRRNPQFASMTQNEVTVRGVRYVLIDFLTSFKPISVGTIKLKATQNLRMNTMDGRAEQTLDYSLPEITVEPLPPPPAGFKSLNLLGYWEVKVEQNLTSVPAGQAVSLTVTVVGDGSLDNLKPPELEIPDCRVYPPEIKKFDGYNTAQICYIVVPLKPGKIDFPLDLATFDTATGTYRTVDGGFRLTVGLGETAAPPPIQAAVENQPSSTETLPLNFKLHRMGEVKLPLWKNHLWISLILLCAGPVVLVVSELARRRRRRRLSDPEWARRSRAAGERGGVLSALKTAPDEKLAGTVNRMLVPFLNDAFNYPPGTTAAEIAGRTGDAELAELLFKVADADYLPADEKKLADPGTFRRRLIKAVRRLTVIAVALLPLTGFSATDDSAEWDKACNLFYGDDSAAAMRAFADMRNVSSADPAVLFNFGSAAVRAGEHPAALRAFEQAHLLAPRDSDILNSLNTQRRRFFIPPAGRNGTTVQMLLSLRDSFRPDEYLFGGSLAVFAFFMLLTFRRHVGKWQLLCGLGLFFVVAAGMFGAAWSQNVAAYSPNRAIVIKNNVRLRTLPSDGNGVGGIPVQVGGQVAITDRRGGFYQVKSGDSVGYLRRDEVEKLLAPPESGGSETTTAETPAERPR